MFIRLSILFFFLLLPLRGEALLCPHVFFEKKNRGEALKRMSGIRAEISILSSFPIANQAHGRVLSWYFIFHGVEATYSHLFLPKSLKRAQAAAQAIHRKFDVSARVDRTEMMIRGHAFRAMTALAQTLVSLDYAYFSSKPEIRILLEFHSQQEQRWHTDWG